MDKQFLYEQIDLHSHLLTQLSDRIWDFSEISMQETKSAAEYIRILQELGFEVETCVANIPTAFIGRYGHQKPIIGILGEFDALSGLSQQPCSTQRAPLNTIENGHGCGHNLLGAASLGAAIALKKAIEQGLISGSVVFYGCPGEEGCAGKTFMARDGLFRDLDAALCWHPGDVNEVTTGSCAACIQIAYTFDGISAHAANDPENGRSALDAAELMNVGVQFLREHMDKYCSVHYCFRDCGGVSPNVVPARATVVYMIRGKTVRQAKKLMARVDKIADGAALMTETTVSRQLVDGTSNTLSNTVMEQILFNNLKSVPLPCYTENEMDFAKQLKSTFTVNKLPGQRTSNDPASEQYILNQTDNGNLALNNFVIDYAPSYSFNPGSTDVGDVSWLTPTAQFTAVTWVSGSPGHSWQNVSIGKHTIAHKGMLYAAKVLSGAAADILADPCLLKKIRNEFTVCAADGYDCPIDQTVKFN